MKIPSLFPILGGRLLKAAGARENFSPQVVSNPWREAIEGSFFVSEDLGR